MTACVSADSMNSMIMLTTQIVKRARMRPRRRALASGGRGTVGLTSQA